MTQQTIAEILKDSEQKLSRSDSPRLDAEILLAWSLGYDRARIYACSNETMQPVAYDRFLNLLNKRLSGHPIAYITGVREFWSMPLEVNEHTLIPRPETECLVEKALECIADDASMMIADLGTGTGAIALAIARERPHCKIIATDNNTETLAIARRNINAQSLNNICLIKSDWFEQLADYRFDFIISNPPYIAEGDPHLHTGDVRFEPGRALSAGPDGMAVLNRIIVNAGSYLVRNGYLLLEHGYQQGEKVETFMQQSGYNCIDKVMDLAGHHRGTIARWPH